MDLETRIEQKQSHQLILTPQMKLVIHLLQLPLIELNTFLEEQITENPVLEEPGENPDKKNSDEDTEFSSGDEKGKDAIDELIDMAEPRTDMFGNQQSDDDQEKKQNFLENMTKKLPTLHEHLMAQLDMFAASDAQRTIGETIIYNIDKNGYLRVPPAEIGADLNVRMGDVKKTLALIQSFSPAGVGAGDLMECLTMQLKLKGRGSSLAGKILKTHLGDLGKKRFKQIAKDLKVSIDRVREAFSEISRLNPKPGAPFGTCAKEITPDILLRSSENSYKVEINNENIPELRISPYYKKLLKSKDTPEDTKEYIKKKLNQAMWLINAVCQRNNTIKKVVKCITIAQKVFLDNNNDPELIKPLTLKEVARAVGVSESTVSRVVANKHIDTPEGVFRLKRFFSGAVKQDNNGSLSTENIKSRIKELVRTEEASRPLSDETIDKKLRSEGIHIARRTVTKYRKEIKIPPSNQRKDLCLE